MKLIVGLGNADAAYKLTRHNVGFEVVECVASKYQGEFYKAARCHGWLADLEIDGLECRALIPATMMNNSGMAVKAAAEKFQCSLADVLVVYDDMALPFGQLRLRPRGSDGGHNGIKSIIAQLGSREFARLRVGIGQAPMGADAADYVLGKFKPAEKKQLPEIINNASLAVHSWVTQGVEAAMNTYNASNKQKEKA